MAVNIKEAPKDLPILQIGELQKPVVKKIALIVPQNGYYTGFQGLVQTEPLGVEYIAGAVRNLAQEVVIADSRVKPDDWKRKIQGADMIGIACQYTADVPAVRDLVGEVNEETQGSVPVVVGGHHIGLRPSDLYMKGVSAIVRGPGEETFRNLVRAWAKRRSFEDVQGIWYRDQDGNYVPNLKPVAKNPPKFEYNSGEMDNRPGPARDLVEEYRGDYSFLFYPKVYSIETARGCRYRCSFCSVWNHHDRKYQTESPNRTVNEILQIPSGYINFVDDLAFSDIDGADELGTELLRLGVNKRFWAQIRLDNVWPKEAAKRKRHQAVFEKLAQAGLDMVLVGIESFDDEELKRVNKGTTADQNERGIEFLRSIGVKIWGAQIVFPEWDIANFDTIIKVNQRLGIEVPQFTILTPLPGTPDYERAVREGTLLTLEPGMYDFFHSVFKTKLPLPQYYSEIARLYKETGTWALKSQSPDSESDKVENKRPKLANRELVLQAARSLARDIKEGRTTQEAIKKFKEKFESLRSEQVHLARLAQSALHQVGVDVLAKAEDFEKAIRDLEILKKQLPVG